MFWEHSFEDCPSSLQQKHQVGNDNSQPVQHESLTSQGNPFRWGFSFYLQPHHLEILASLHCTVAKTFLKPPAFFCYKLYVHKLYVSNCVSDKHSICNSVMIPGLGLGRIDLALTQSNPIYTCSTQLFHPAQHPSLHLICLWETSFSHSRLWNRTVKVPEAMG